MGASGLKRFVRPALIALATVASVLFVRSLDPERMLAVLATANPLWVILAMVVNGTLRIGTRVMRTRTLVVALGAEVPLRELVHFIYGAIALGYLTSPIAGSAARVFALQRHGVPAEAMVAVQLWEKTIAGCALAAFAAPMLLRDTPPPAHYALLVATLLGSVGAVIAVIAVAGFRWLARRTGETPKGRVKRWLFGLGHAMSRLHDLRVLARVFVWSALSELCDVIMLALALHALGQPVDPAACVLGYIALNVGSAIPSTPGQLGVFEATVAWALTAMGVPASAALATGLLYHLIHAVPVLLLGLPSLLRIRREASADDHARAAGRSHGDAAEDPR